MIEHKTNIRVVNYSEDFFGLNEEVIDVFHNTFYIPTIENWKFNIAHIRILDSTEYGRTGNDYYQVNTVKIFEVKEILCGKIRKTTGIEIQSKHWYRNGKLSME